MGDVEMLRKYYPQKLYLFVCYGTLIFAFFCGFFTYAYSSYSKKVYSEAKIRSENACASVHNSVGAALDNLSTISMNIVYSNAIRQNFIEFSSAGGFVETRPGVQSIYNTITSMIGVYQSASQINLYTFNNEMIGTGYFQRALVVELNSYDWFLPTVEANGHRYLTDPSFISNIPAEGENQKSKMFISLNRVFFDKSGAPEGIVEVIQDCHAIFGLIPQLHSNTPTMQYYVYNEKDHLVYPYTSGQAPPHLLDYIRDVRPSSPQMLTMEDGSQALITYQKLDKYGWTVLVVEDRLSVFADLNRFKNSFAVIIVLILLCTMLLCFTISDSLTRPLNRLAAAVRGITFSQVLDHQQELDLAANSRIQEIALLYQSFQTMQTKMTDSLTQAMLAHSEETKAKFQASQSMINPHFLFNSLTTISIMAEENMNPEIVHMCQLLCDYFRYISTGGEMVIPLEKELENTVKFISCMQLRFGDNFSYQCDIEPAARDIPIPKLIIQPFVENAFKHAFMVAPPWRLEIRAYCREDRWFVEIEDSAGLLSPKKARELLFQYETASADKDALALSIGGMGLKNAGIRLKVLYGDKAVYQIQTGAGKTIFTIGGAIHPNEGEFYEHSPEV